MLNPAPCGSGMGRWENMKFSFHPRLEYKSIWLYCLNASSIPHLGRQLLGTVVRMYVMWQFVLSFNKAWA